MLYQLAAYQEWRTWLWMEELVERQIEFEWIWWLRRIT